MSASSSPKKKAAASKKPAASAKPAAGAKKSVAKKKPSAPKKSGGSKAKASAGWMLRLYVAGQTPKSLTALANLKRLCETHLGNEYEIEVVDLMQQPHLAAKDQIVALPTLVRRIPAPIKRIVGDLSNIDRVLVGMDVAMITR